MSASFDACYGPSELDDEVPGDTLAALRIICRELQNIRRTLVFATFDPNCETSFASLGSLSDIEVALRDHTAAGG